MAFEKLFDASNGSIFKFEAVGQSLEGYYMGSFDYEGDYGLTKKHVFQTKKGAEIIFGQRNLIQLLPTVTAGTMVRITYTGDLPPKKKGQHPMKLFGVEQDRKNKIDVVGVDLAPTNDYEDVVEETDLTDEEPPVDVVAPTRAAAPRTPAKAPDAERQAKVQALLASRRTG